MYSVSGASCTPFVLIRDERDDVDALCIPAFMRCFSLRFKGCTLEDRLIKEEKIFREREERSGLRFSSERELRDEDACVDGSICLVGCQARG